MAKVTRFLIVVVDMEDATKPEFVRGVLEEAMGNATRRWSSLIHRYEVRIVEDTEEDDYPSEEELDTLPIGSVVYEDNYPSGN